MESIQTLAKCLGIIGIFMFPLLAVFVIYYILINLENFGHLLNLTDFLTILSHHAPFGT